MKNKYLSTLLLSAVPMACFSQTEKRDSISIGEGSPDNVSMDIAAMPDSIAGSISPIEYRRGTPHTIDFLFPYTMTHPLDLHIPDLEFTPGQASLLHWNSGAFVASGVTKAYPGLMQIDSGAIGIYQSIGNFTFHAGGLVNKYGYFNGLHTQYGLNGSIAYQFSPKVSATIFGDYYFGQPPRMANGTPMPPSMIGYFGRSTFGGYMDFRINERWGVQTGVQTVQQVGTNRYKAEPIVTPYYRISKKVAIGLPVGQILYHILKK